MANKDNAPRDFGRFLQAQRHARGMSLEKVAQQTRITPVILQQIESEDLEKLPAEVFVKGFLRAYAQAVHADQAEVLKRYEARCRSQAKWNRNQSQAPERYFWLRILLALLLFSLLVAGTLYFAHYRTAHKNGQPSQTAAEQTALNADALEASSPEELSDDEGYKKKMPAGSVTEEGAEMSRQPDEAAPEPARRRAPFVLELESVEPTWLKIISDGGVPQVFTIQPGDRLTFEAQDGFSLLVGNAGGIRAVFNGRSVPVLGKSGQVVTLQLP